MGHTHQGENMEDNYSSANWFLSKGTELQISACGLDHFAALALPNFPRAGDYRFQLVGTKIAERLALFNRLALHSHLPANSYA